MPSSLTTLYQPTVLKKWYIPKLKKFCIKRFTCNNVCHGNVLKSAWQVQNEGQHEGSAVEPVADKMTIALKIDFRIQGFSRAEVEQYEERCRKQYLGMPCGPKPFRTISFFWELISRFEFDVRRCGFFLNDSNFWCVQSSITHNEAVHVPVLWPVCAHTIPFRMLLCP